MLQGTPILVLKEGTEREKGKGAVNNNISAAKAIADAVRTTLGPRGMDKMLVDGMGDITITNDGVTILKEIDVDHPTAKMLVEVAKTQDQQCGDGTTTAVVLAGEFLKKSEDLLEQNVHPTVLTRGFSVAMKEAERLLKEEIGIAVTPDDIATLTTVARTAMNSKGVDGKDELANLVVRAVRDIVEKREGKNLADVALIQVEKKAGGAITDTELIEGLVLDKERGHTRMPKEIKNAKIVLLNSALEIKKTEFESKINIKSPTQIQGFLDEEEKTLRDMASKVKEVGANVVVCQKGIDDLVLHFLAKAGIFAVKQVKESDMNKLARATGGRVVVGIKELASKDLGSAAKVEERKIGDSNMTFITGCNNPRSVSILIRGGTEHVVQEIERSLHDALKVVAATVEDGYICPGGGATEMALAVRLRKFAPTVGGREQLAVEAFAQALEIIPWSLAENAGYDAINTIIELRQQHEAKNKNAGVNVENGKWVDAIERKIVEPMRVKQQAISSATEVANMVLRIDDVIASRKPAGGMPSPGGDHSH